MKIALFTDSYLPVPNGVSIAVRSLSQELQALGHETHIFAPHFQGHEDTEPNIHRFPSVQPPVPYRYPFGLPLSSQVARQFDDIGIELVHTHTPFFVGFTGRNWARHLGLPLVSTYHTLYEQYLHYVPVVPKPLLKPLLAGYLRFYYNGCGALIAPSQTAKSSLQTYRVRPSITIIPTGMPAAPPLDRQQERQKLGFADELVMLFVGRLALEKNLSTLLDAAKKMFESAPDLKAKLLLVGDGPQKGELEARAQSLGVQEKVVFTGAIPREEVNRYYAASDLFVFSSQTETQGLVIGEAQTFGLPCVAIKGGGASEMIADGQNGFVVENDAASFAQKTLKLLADERLRVQFGQAALSQWKGQTPRETACRVIEVYRSVMKPDSKRR